MVVKPVAVIIHVITAKHERRVFRRVHKRVPFRLALRRVAPDGKCRGVVIPGFPQGQAHVKDLLVLADGFETNPGVKPDGPGIVTMDFEIKFVKAHFFCLTEDKAQHLPAQTVIPIIPVANVSPVFSLMPGDVFQSQGADGNPVAGQTPDQIVCPFGQPGKPAQLFFPVKIRGHGEPFDFRIAKPVP